MLKPRRSSATQRPPNPSPTCIADHISAAAATDHTPVASTSAGTGQARNRDGDTSGKGTPKGKGPAKGAPEKNDNTTPGRKSLHTMECSTCERSQRRFFCPTCVANHIRDFRLSQSRVEAEKQRLQGVVQQLLDKLEPRRTEKATRTLLIDRTREIKREVERLRHRSAELKENVRLRQEDLRQRRERLQRAQQLVSSPLTFTPLTAAQSRLDALSDRLALARRGLALLLMEVFDLRQTTTGEATIVSLPFPKPGDHRHTKPEQLNGVLVHTLHLLHLLAYYLGVKLPFVISWSGGRFLVGKPTIRASSGNSEDGDWVRWTVKQPLYISAADAARYAGAGAVPSSFTTALSMLAFNVLYLMHTQGLSVPGDGPSPATPPPPIRNGENQLPPRVLNDLICLCIPDSLGRRSHATRPHLPPPTHGLGLTFARVLEAAKEADGSKRAEELRKAEEGDADWDIIDDSG
ncbi:hypothetical protein DACRYDRAFT_112868 [Dacryopinax primogenitus]|uniref:Autophagy-related protein 14 n=1 Tax=Dacryopinax primogenitus (strain DJM 731) TaxID=1858805 RepID=M5GB03_DACPD|nr:uncharacterized protein DACRYDRAFT_112868 [Dacryopinax primogenitus]EJU06089.1 hypothetical protein DACRYDRAFT_112868 [Dacryopinax primogenitus]